MRLDLRIGVALGDLVHDRRGALAVPECAHLFNDVGLLLAGQVGIAPCALPSVPWQFAQFEASSAADRVSASGVAARRPQSGSASRHAIVIVVFMDLLVKENGPQSGPL